MIQAVALTKLTLAPVFLQRANFRWEKTYKYTNRSYLTILALLCCLDTSWQPYNISCVFVIYLRVQMGHTLIFH